jgi:peptide/nickel transport system substrate-binding protein
VAESWASNSDFTQWIFKIRDDLKWHDGTLFSAEDFKFWAELSFYGAQVEGKSRVPSFYKHTFGDMKEVAVLTGNRVRITLGAGDPLYPVTLLEPRNQVAHPRHLMKPLLDKGEVNVAPEDVGWVSIGAFKMLKADKGVKVQVRRNDLYWEKDQQGRQLPYLDGIDYAILRDPVSQDAAIRVGRADGGAKFPLYTLEVERKARYVQDLGDKVWFAEVVSFGNDLIFNAVKSGPFQDTRVRKAISLWYDRQGFIDAIHSGAAVTATLMAPGNPFTTPDYKTWPGYNPATRAADREDARRLMAAAGYSEKAAQVTFPCRNTRVVICEHVQSAVKGLGIDVRLNILDTAAWTRETRGPGIDFSEGGLANAGAFVPEHLFAAISRYSVAPGAVLIRHEDPKIDDFVQQLRGAVTSYDQRVGIYRQLERYILLDQVYEIVQARQLSVIPYRSYVKGLWIPREHLYNLNDFATVWLDK